MNKIFTIAKKELGTYFKSPMAYIILVITISIFNIFFFAIIDQNREASLKDMFRIMEFMFVFVVPLLTMKTISEEKRAGTLEFLLTSPITNAQLVLGKYAGTLLFLTLIIALTTIYYAMIEMFSTIDKIATLVGYLGIWVEGALFVAVGLWTSSLTRNQLIAAMSSYAILLMLYFSSALTKYADPTTQDIIKNISLLNRSENFSSGLITVGDGVYFISMILFFIFLTYFNIKSRQ